MPLTNVWHKDKQGEWAEISAVEAERIYPYSVSAYSHMFRCYKCFHYVEFRAESSLQCSHFKHCRGDVDKECEDRSTSNANNTYESTWDTAAPMRLQINSGRVDLAVGFLPLNHEKLDKLSSESASWELSGSYGAPAVYRIDASRFKPYETA